MTDRNDEPNTASPDEQAEHLREVDEPVQESTVDETDAVLDEYGEDVASSPEQRSRSVPDDSDDAT
ncbi:hypothetical protein [Paramicrobacterium agarici]|uniref:hypothetical protein n=1 Tax=Paramicrobacterium agarici TaxID=630514 RepID=UPI00114D8F34|nr:hypothetical protein [Microbacterium agarici]TQO22184.1 hypothetical protein FB385_1005 [Microbacterium agarici]